MDLLLSINNNKSFHLNTLYNFMNFRPVQNLRYQESQYMGQYCFSFYEAVNKFSIILEKMGLWG